MSPNDNEPDNDERNFTKWKLSEYFLMEERTLSTISSDAYRARWIARDLDVCIWVRRDRAATVGTARRFNERVFAINKISSLAEMISFGLDANKTPFIVLPVLEGSPLAPARYDFKKSERIFIEAVKLVEKLHSNGIVCGDLCRASFWLEPDGNVQIVGLIGFGDLSVIDMKGPIPEEVQHFLSPEQTSGGPPTTASDVYSLGVLGFYLFTHNSPFSARPASAWASPTDVLSLETVDGWVREVLTKCISPSPENRLSGATAILDTIRDTRKRFEALSKKVQKSAAASEVDQTLRPRVFAGHANSIRRERRMRMLLVGCFLVGLLLPMGYLATNYFPSQERQAAEHRVTYARARAAEASVSHDPLAGLSLPSTQPKPETRSSDRAFVSQISSMNREEILQMLDGILLSGSSTAKNVLAHATEKHTLTAFENDLLLTAATHRDIPTAIIQSALHVVAGTTRPDDLKRVGQWDNLDAGPLLLKMLGNISDAGLLIQGFDILAGLSEMPDRLRALTDTIAQNHSSDRGQMVRLIGISENYDRATETQKAFAKKMLDTLSNDREFLGRLMDGARPAFLLAVLDSYSERLGLASFADLLSNPEIEVRRSAIRHASRFNQYPELHVIEEHYRTELNSDVKAEYRRLFPKIKM